MSNSPDPVIWDLWHPVASLWDLQRNGREQTLLLDQKIVVGVGQDGAPEAYRTNREMPINEPWVGEEPLPVKQHLGFLWTSLGSPTDEIFSIPEAEETDRTNVHAATVGVACSAPRAIENFLDIAHFPYVHTDILGVEPHTEVVDYDVDYENGEIWTRNVFYYQPQAAVQQSGGVLAHYWYRVPHPYVAVLYKASGAESERMDIVIALLVQAMTETSSRVRMFNSNLDDQSSTTQIRHWNNEIFGQDKPIIENQHPKRLPLDPRVETPIRADKLAIAYRRWLSDLGVTYGVIPSQHSSFGAA